MCGSTGGACAAGQTGACARLRVGTCTDPVLNLFYLIKTHLYGGLAAED